MKAKPLQWFGGAARTCRASGRSPRGAGRLGGAVHQGAEGPGGAALQEAMGSGGLQPSEEIQVFNHDKCKKGSGTYLLTVWMGY